ncbi:melanopsin-A-like [Dermacentor albipictus]|uniref:melanopsin-A-like n=1 Tax=Dermacentor albipictus TaxID=60249 RepID=UPI0031FCCBC9
MELNVERERLALTPHLGAISTNLTARNQAPAFPNFIALDQSSEILPFVPSGEASAVASDRAVDIEDNQSSLSFRYIRLEVHFTLLLVIMVSSVAVNGLVFVLFYQRPSVRMTSNKFVLNMAIVYLLQNFTLLPFIFASIMFQEWIFGDVWCKIHGTLSLCLTLANVFSILLIAVDRNCAVNSPLHYSMTITKKRTSGLIVSTWLVAIVVALPPLCGVSDIKYQESWAMCTVAWQDTGFLTIAYSCVFCVVGFLLPFIRITWIYASMLKAARRNSACTRLNFHAVGNEISQPSMVATEVGNHASPYLHRKLAWSKRTSSLSQASSIFGDKWKALRTGVLVVVSFTGCFLPFFSMTLVEPHARTRKTALHDLPAIAMLLLFCSSLINPYLYVIRSKVMRKHVHKMFTRLTRKPSFFSPRGYHHSHQSPLQERKCSEDMKMPGSAASLHPRESADCQTPFVAHSLCQSKTGDWKIVTITTDSRRSSSRRSCITLEHPVFIDSATQELQSHQQQQWRYRCKPGPSLRVATMRSGFNRRASLDGSKLMSARFSSMPPRSSEVTAVKSTTYTGGDRSMSFRTRGRFANREELIEAHGPSCNSSSCQEMWGRHFVDSSRCRTPSHATYDSRNSTSAVLGCGEMYSRLSTVDSVAQVHSYEKVSSAYDTSAVAAYHRRPVLKRGRSFAFDEHEMSMAFSPQRISYCGGLRKSRFALARNSLRHSSTDTTTTTLESLTSTESQDGPVIATPESYAPCYESSVILAQQYCQREHATRNGDILPSSLRSSAIHQRTPHGHLPCECQDRRDSGFEDAMLGKGIMCDTIVNEAGSIKAVKFLERM